MKHRGPRQITCANGYAEMMPGNVPTQTVCHSVDHLVLLLVCCRKHYLVFVFGKGGGAGVIMSRRDLNVGFARSSDMLPAPGAGEKHGLRAWLLVFWLCGFLAVCFLFFLAFWPRSWIPVSLGAWRLPQLLWPGEKSIHPPKPQNG